MPKSIAETSELKPISSLKDNQLPKYYYDSETGLYKVKVGGGGGRIVVMDYYPQNLEINVGDTVKFYNPTKVPEPHTVTFIADSKYTPKFEAPFSIKDPDSLEALPNDVNSEPLIIPLGEESQAVIAANARMFFPYVVDSSGKATNLGPNAKYSFNGSEKYVNSGMLIPKAYVDSIPGSSEIFTVEFENPGTFQYICILHPWMTGQIIVTE